MSNLSMGLCGKVAISVVWYTFVPLDSDLSTGYSYPPFEQLGPGQVSYPQIFSKSEQRFIILQFKTRPKLT